MWNTLRALALIVCLPILAVIAADCYFYVFAMVATFKTGAPGWLFLRVLLDRPWALALITLVWFLVLICAGSQRRHDDQ